MVLYGNRENPEEIELVWKSQIKEDKTHPQHETRKFKTWKQMPIIHNVYKPKFAKF